MLHRKNDMRNVRALHDMSEAHDKFVACMSDGRRNHSKRSGSATSSQLLPKVERSKEIVIRAMQSYHLSRMGAHMYLISETNDVPPTCH